MIMDQLNLLIPINRLFSLEKVQHNNNKILKNLWHDFPFSMSRLFFLFYFNFEPATSLSMQTSSVQEELSAKNVIKKERTEGFKIIFLQLLPLQKRIKLFPLQLRQIMIIIEKIHMPKIL